MPIVKPIYVCTRRDSSYTRTVDRTDLIVNDMCGNGVSPTAQDVGKLLIIGGHPNSRISCS